MSRILWSALVERLEPAVLQYSTTHFVLQGDLINLAKVKGVDAAEATILYGARILEALAADALQRVGLQASTNVFSNLDSLQQFNLMPATTRYWAHARRRRFGNSVRHLHCRVGPVDADLTLVFVARWLEWFFCHFSYGHCLDSLLPDRESFRLTDWDELAVLIEEFAEGKRDFPGLLQQIYSRYYTVFLSTATLPAVVAETLLDRGEHAEVNRVLCPALAQFPDDLRLRQLKGLYFSRTKDLDNALKCLEPLYAHHKDDEETAGITAGVYKRKWLVDKSKRKWLDMAHRAYVTGWERSKRTSAYLGINAATTALWLGHPEQSSVLAEEVRQLLNERVERLAQHPAGQNLILNYWDHVTLAEAELLLGRVADAARTYQQAADNHPNERDNIAVSRQQADEILKALKLSWPAPAGA